MIEASGEIEHMDKSTMTYSFRDYSQTQLTTTIVSGYSQGVHVGVHDDVQNTIVKFVGEQAFCHHYTVKQRRRSIPKVHIHPLYILYDPDRPMIQYLSSELPICGHGRQFMKSVFYLLCIRGAALAFVSLLYGIVIAVTHSGYPWRGLWVTVWTIVGIFLVTVIWIVYAHCCYLCSTRIEKEIKVDEYDREICSKPRQKCGSIDLSVHMDGHFDTVTLGYDHDGTLGTMQRSERTRNRTQRPRHQGPIVYDSLRVLYA